MRPAENIKRLLENAKVKINPEVKKAALSELISELEKTKITRSAETGPNVWRIIMKSKLTKLAAAAVIIIAVILSINYFGGSINVTSVALGKVLEKMTEVPFMQTVVTEVHGDLKREYTVWHNFQQNKAFADYNDAIWCWDQNANKQYMYRFIDRLLIISELPKEGFYSSVSAYSLVKDFIEYSKSDQHKISSTIVPINGENAEIFKLRKQYGDNTPMFMDGQPVFAVETSLAVDIKTLLLIDGKVEFLDKNGQTITLSKFEITYPQDGPSQIYDLGVPNTAKIFYKDPNNP